MAGEAFSEKRFDELELNDDIKRGVEKCGFELMTPIQAAAIPALLTGRDVIGQAQTGTGKTAAFGLPLLQMVDPKDKHLQVVVLCPTRELAMQVASEIRNFATYMHDVKLLPVYGGQDITKQIIGLKGTQIIVGTPGRVMDHMRRHTIKLDHVKLCVLDEADEMLKMGFREDMEVILGAIEHPHQTCLFSATMPQEILDITNNFQENPEFIKITPKELTIERIDQYYYAVKREYKTQAILRLLAYYQYQKSIIFCNTKAMTDELATELKTAGYSVEALHGDLAQKQRDVVMNNFRTGASDILIATDIAARGIDVDDVEAVFNYDIPMETEYYVHRIGRTGRAGRTGVSHTLCKSKDFRKLHEIEEICHTKMEERKIPSTESINELKVKKTLETALSVAKEGAGNKFISLINDCCEKTEVNPSELAAAFLKIEIGEMLEDIVIDLPDSKSKKQSNRDEGRRKDAVKNGTIKEKSAERKGKYSDKTKDIKSDRKKSSEKSARTKKRFDVKQPQTSKDKGPNRASSKHHERLNMKGERVVKKNK